MIRTCRATGQTVKVTFVLPAEQPSGRVSVVGEFNGWEPGVHELRKRSNGTRSVSVHVPHGTELCFRYLGESGEWFDDPDVRYRDDRGCLFTALSG